MKPSASYDSSDNAFPYKRLAGDLTALLIKGFPDRLVWASNWPHLELTRQADWPMQKIRCDV